MENDDDKVFSSVEKVFADIKSCYNDEELCSIAVKRFHIDGKEGTMEARFLSDGSLLSIDGHYYIDSNYQEWFPDTQDIDFYKIIGYDLAGMYYIDIPTPFKKGNILHNTCSYSLIASEPFVFKNISYVEKRAKGAMLSDGSDLCGWGYFVTDSGVLIGDHIWAYDSCVYFKGKMEGNYRVLHYLKLYLNSKIDLPELLTMQNRIMLEKIINTDLPIESHGIYIPDELLVENRFTQDGYNEVLPDVRGEDL